MVLQKAHSYDTKNISFSDVKTNSNGGKSIYINLDRSKFQLQTSVMTLPFDLNVYDKGEYPKYSIEISFRDMEDNYKVSGFYENMDQLDKLIIKQAAKNSKSWFGKKMSDEVLEALYTPIVKRSKDKSGEFDGKYPPRMKLKLPFYNGKISYEMVNFKDEVLEDMDQETAFTKGSKIQAIIKCGGIWIVGGKFGCTWSVEKVRVEGNPTIQNYSFVDDDDDSDSD